jgi:hypothetical protein
MYEDEEMPLRGKHLEDWYCYNVWSDIIDMSFRGLRHVTLERYIPNGSTFLSTLLISGVAEKSFANLLRCAKTATGQKHHRE